MREPEVWWSSSSPCRYIIRPYRQFYFLLSTFLFSAIDILILPYRRSYDAFHFTYYTSFSLEFAMNTKSFLLGQAPTSNIRGCIEDSLPLPPLPSPKASPLPRRRVNKKPTRFREAPDHLVKLPKEGHRYLSKDNRPLWDDRYAYSRPVPRRTRSKRCPRARIGSPSPVPEAIAQSEPASPVKKRRIKFIVKKPLVEFNGNKPPTKIKLKLNPTR